MPPRQKKFSNGSGSDTRRQAFDLVGGLAGLITSIKPFALCDSCIALDVHVSRAEAQEAAVRVAMSDVFKRGLQRCHGCVRKVEATSVSDAPGLAGSR